jgi:hypothetical protein
MWFFKVLLVVVFLIVFYQDYKDRFVYWFLYPLVGLLVFSIQIGSVTIFSALINVGLNLLFVFFFLVVSYLYSKTRLQPGSFREVLGEGDVLFFIFISFSFATVSFLVLFVFSLFFSLLLHLLFKYKNTDKTVPLAGYMALFFGSIYAISFFCETNYLYAY